MLEYIRKSKNYKYLCDYISCKKSRINLTGIISSYAANIACALTSENNENIPDKIVYIAGNSLFASKIVEDLRFFASKPDEILTLSPYEYMLYDVESKSSELSSQRVDVLYRLLQGNWKILITTPVAVAQWFPNPQYIKNSGIKIKTGEIIEIDDLAKKLSSIRYMRLSEIDGKGHTIDGKNQSRALAIYGSNITVSNLQIINGENEYGGGIINFATNLTLNNITFTAPIITSKLNTAQ